MKVQVFDFRWQDAETCVFQASKGTKYGQKPIKVGDRLSLEVCSSSIMCAGAMVEGKWQPCENFGMGKPKCDTCRMKEGNFAIMMFDGFNSQNFSTDELNVLAADPHYVYLAMFEKGVMKVGVTKEPRKTLRQVEQGSAYTLYIAHTPDGISARQIETLIARSGLKDKIKGSQKKGLVVPEVTKEEAETDMRAFLPNVDAALLNYPKLKKYLTDPAEFICWDETYNIEALRVSKLPFHPVKLENEEFVSGVIESIKGPFITINTGEELVSVYAKDLRGLDVEFEEKKDGLKLNTALQNTLF